MNTMRKLFHITKENIARTVFLRILTFILALLGVKGSFDRGIAVHLIPTNITSNPQNTSFIDEKSLYVPNSAIAKSTTLSTTTSSTNSSFLQTGGRNGGRHGGDFQRSFTDTSIDENETQNDFLGRLICTGCGKQCSLLSPQCATGSSQAEQAITYYESYNTETTTQTNEQDSVVSNNTEDSKDQNLNQDNTVSDTQSENSQNLSEYLGSLNCDGCHKRCSLLSPQCNIGTEQAKTATLEYNNSVSSESSETSNSSSDSRTESGNRIIFDVDSKGEDSLIHLFTDFVPIMGLYIAGAYYSLELIDKAKKKKDEKNK